MHHIYGNPELTIIAATGYDSASGIPGVNGKLCTERGDFRIGRLRFVQHYPYLKEYRSTYWGTPGWTFQEEIFSSRQLIFTDYEAFFACPRTPLEFGREHLDPNWPDTNWETYLTNEYREHEDHGRNLEFPENIMDMIGNYSSRTLTYETDVINAFSGCLGMLEQTDPPVYHLWGSPIPLHPARGSLDWFQIGLQWTLDMGSSSLRRRAGFPSWSWTGWIGRVSMRQYHEMNQTHEGSHTPDISVALELETGGRLDWLDVEKRSFLKDQPELISRFIFLRAWTTLITLEFYPVLNSRKMRLYAVMKTINGGEVLCPAVLLSEGSSDPDRERIPPLEKKDFTGVILMHSPIHGREAYIMLVSKADESEVKDYYVRVGYAELYDWIFVPDGAGDISRRDRKDLEPLQREIKEIRLG